MGWAKNGEAAGTARYAKRLEAIQIVLCRKGTAPGANVAGIVSATSDSYKDALNPTPTTPTTPTVPTVPTTPTVPQNPTLQPALTQTVTYYQCDSCNNIYRTEEELEQHFAFWDPKYHVICSCGVNKAGTKRTATFTIRDAYYSNQVVPETHKVVWVATEPAYTETKEIVEMVPYSYCFMCKKRFYKDDIAADGEYISDHTYNHIMNADPYSNIIDGEKERRVVGTETVTEPEYGYYEVQ